jgi:hypothetical protein
MKRKQPKNKDRKSRKSIGIIAEDQSDVDVLTVLIGKIAKRPFSVRRIVGGGCGKIVGKCRAWAQNLQAQGCRYLLVVHDLDTRNIGDLRNQLEAALRPCPIGQHLIVIPVREIEHGSWQITLRSREP